MVLDKESFDEIVATGSSSGEPHHHPTDKPLKAGDLLKIDLVLYTKVIQLT